MNAKTAKKLRRMAAQITAGQPPEATRAWYRDLKAMTRKKERVIWDA